MTTIVTQPKIHNFAPLARTRLHQAKMAISGVPESLPEYRKTPLAVGATTYQFPVGFFPLRVDDILLEDALGDKRVLPNREQPRMGPGGSTIFGHTAYDLDVATGVLTFHQPLERALTMHWYCMQRSTNFAKDWITVSLSDMLIQGTNYIDEDLIPPNEPNLTGKFQGACRCFSEIVSLPAQGLIRKSDDLMGFMYRPRQGFVGLDSVEYLIYNSWGQVSDTYCFTFQMS